jgi:GWxTD domain-containing protein
MSVARKFVVAVAMAVIAVPFSGAEPSDALAAGRQHIANKQFEAAVRVLQDAVPNAAAMTEPRRTQALAALHFYTAVAFSGMKDDRNTRDALEHFFFLSPNMKTIDPAKFDAEFVRHFNEVSASMTMERPAAFDAAYPAYRMFRDEAPQERPLDQWGAGPEMTLLGTAAEKTEWRQLRDEDARRQFIETFWKRRDRTPEDDTNEVRAEFLRRIAFADQAFVTESTRGALTDRGRVFVLLGPPSIVRHANLTERDGARVVGKRGPITASSSGPGGRASWAAMELSERALLTPSLDPTVKGKVERWIYGRDQLPKGFPDDQVSFKFLTEEGYGENVLQRDFLALKALKDAGQVH